MGERPPDPARAERHSRVKALHLAYSGDMARWLRGADQSLCFQDIRDILQEVWTKLLTSRATIPAPGPTEQAWLMTTVRNALADHQRKKASRSRAVRRLFAGRRKAAGAEVQPETAPSDWEPVEVKLQQMSPKEQECLWALAWSDESRKNESVADQLGISSQAADGRIRRALQKLRDMLNEGDAQ